MEDLAVASSNERPGKEGAAVERDLEMTKLCAAAMGYGDVGVNGGLVWCVAVGYYTPLHDAAQAFALMERCCLEVTPHNDGDHIVYFVRRFGTLRPPGPSTESDDLKRGIVECVAQMQAERATESSQVRSRDNATLK